MGRFSISIYIHRVGRKPVLEEMVKYFKSVKLEKTAHTLDVTLEERDNGFDGYPTEGLHPNDFYKKEYSQGFLARDIR